MSVNNFEFGTYDRDDVPSGYFGPPVLSKEDETSLFLKDLGLIGNQEKIQEKPKINFATGVAKGVGEVFGEIGSGLRILGSDIRKIETGRLEETEGLLGDFFKAGEGRMEKIQELNKSIDETGGSDFDKVIGTGLNVIGAGVDFTGDAIVSGLKTLAPEGLEKATVENIQAFGESDFGQNVIGFVKEGGEKYQQFKDSSPEANRLGLTIESLLPVGELATGGVGAKLTKELGETIIKKSTDITLNMVESGKKQIDDFLTKTEQGKTLQKEIDFIQSLSKDKPKTSFRNKQAESIIAKTNSMLPTDKQDFVKISGVNYQTWLNQRGFRGTGEENIDGLAQKFIKEKNAIDSAMEQIPGRYNLQSFNTILDETLNFAIGVENTKNIKLLQGIRQGLEETGGVSAKDIRKVKQIYERENKFNYINDKNSALVTRTTNRDDALREDLIKLSEKFGVNLRDVSKELQQTKALLNGIGKKLGRQTEGNVFDISDRIIGPTAVVEPTILLGIGAKSVLSSLKPSIAKILGNDNITIPKINEARLRQKVKEYEQALKDLKKAKKKEAKRVALEKMKQDILDLVTPSDVRILPKAKTITEVPDKVTKANEDAIDKSLIEESKKGLGGVVQPKRTSPGLELANEGSESIFNATSPEELRDIIDAIDESKEIDVLIQQKLIRKANEKIDLFESTNNTDLIQSEGIKIEYGDKLLNAFRVLRGDENRVIKTKSGDKFTKVEFLDSKNAKKFSTLVQEYLQENEWINKSVQEIYEDLKDQL